MKNKEIREIFKENPELSKIGTKTKYEKYLKIIFPRTEIKKNCLPLF